jgi:hypothetical protein
VIIGIHAQHNTRLLVWVTTLVSMVCAGTLIRVAASFLPPAARMDEAASTAAGAGEPLDRAPATARLA